MTFDEAIEKLTYGKKVRRESWDSHVNTVWYESNGSDIWLKCYSESDKQITIIKDYRHGTPVFSLDDVLADDWEVVR